MVKSDKLGSARRFGTRYGRTTKHRFARIEAEARASTKCPFCLYSQVKRIATGIFSCGKCHAQFTGRAYTIAPIKPIVQEVVTQKMDLIEEVEEAIEEVEQ